MAAKKEKKKLEGEEEEKEEEEEFDAAHVKPDVRGGWELTGVANFSAH